MPRGTDSKETLRSMAKRWNETPEEWIKRINSGLMFWTEDGRPLSIREYRTLHAQLSQERKMSEQYHCFYVYAYGREPRYECFDDEKKMLDLVRKANEPDSPYRNLQVIYGKMLSFMPLKIVEVWAIRDSD